MRGDLVSRPIGEVLAEAKRLKEAGVKEILVISQDTSAYGVDVKHRTGFTTACRSRPAWWPCAKSWPSSACGCACTTSTRTRTWMTSSR